jgi:hypothetical protein
VTTSQVSKLECLGAKGRRAPERQDRCDRMNKTFQFARGLLQSSENTDASFDPVPLSRQHLNLGR